MTAVDFAQLFAMFTLRLSHALCQSDTIEQRTPKGPFMPLLSLQQVLALTGTPFPKFQTLRRRDQIAMAFGRRLAAASLSYIPADCVGMLLVATLGEAYGDKLTFPAQLVRVYGDMWLECVARAEAPGSNHPDVHFCVIDLERESDGKTGHMVAGSTAMAPEQTAFTVGQPQGWVQTRINSVNVSVLIRRIRRAAVKEQIDLDAPFMPPVGTGEFEKLMECDYFKGRDQLFTDSKTIKSREAAGAKHGEAARAMVIQ